MRPRAFPLPLRKKFQPLAEPDITEKLLALGISADFIAGDQQRDINARDIEAWKKVASDAKIEIK
jgi:hypothetical protein